MLNPQLIYDHSGDFAALYLLGLFNLTIFPQTGRRTDDLPVFGGSDRPEKGKPPEDINNLGKFGEHHAGGSLNGSLSVGVERPVRCSSRTTIRHERNGLNPSWVIETSSLHYSAEFDCFCVSLFWFLLQ